MGRPMGGNEKDLQNETVSGILQFKVRSCPETKFKEASSDRTVHCCAPPPTPKPKRDSGGGRLRVRNRGGGGNPVQNIRRITAGHAGPLANRTGVVSGYGASLLPPAPHTAAAWTGNGKHPPTPGPPTTPEVNSVGRQLPRWALPYVGFGM